jgi:hypothetical protein
VTARARVEMMRGILAALVVLASAIWFVTGLFFGYALWNTLALLGVVSAATAAARPFLIDGSALLFAGAALWRARRVWRREAVALWLEERAPSLRYALVTAAGSPSGASVPELEQQVAATALGWPAAREAARWIAVPAVAYAVVYLWAGALPERSFGRGGFGSGVEPGGAPAASAASRLAPLKATVSPPAYSALATRTFDEPSSIPGLVASSVLLEGRGSGAGISALVNGSTFQAESDGSRWRLNFKMPAKATALTLTDRTFHRLIVLEPLPDSAPVVTLLAPLHDTVFRQPTGEIALAADARDDFGLADAWLEYIVSSGEGESFTFKSGILNRVEGANQKAVSLHAMLTLSALNLKPGDIVHLRAVARDRNDATGPDTGVSETRTLRIARRGEYDSVAVEAAAPPDPDKNVLSQRMLIMLAESLQRRRNKMEREPFVSESRHIAKDQARLRKEVSRVIFARLGAGSESEESEGGDQSQTMTPDQLLAAADSATNASGTALDFGGDETPVVAVNRTLLEAYNAMWDATIRLDVGEPAEALPFMRIALAAIQRARAAERLYLRGRPPVGVVDLTKVRLAGKRDDAAGTTRTPRSALDSTAARRARRFDRALALLAADPRAATDSLLLLRVDAIAQDPRFAAALGVAIDSLRGGHDATAALARARRAAAGAPATEKDGARWEGAW